MYKTTAKDFEVFKVALSKAICNFQLSEWDISIEHGEWIDCDEGRLAFTQTQLESMRAVIGLEQDWGDEKPTKENIIKAAKHEACELLLAEIYHICTRRDNFTVERLSNAFHRVINKLVYIM